MRYFSEKAQQELNYSRTPLIKTEATLKDNFFYKNLYKNLGSAIT